MDEKAIKQFFSDRVPLTGRLSDYVLTIGQHNRVLSTRQHNTSGNNLLIIPPNPNRVSIFASCLLSDSVSAQRAVIRFLNPNGIPIFHHTLIHQHPVDPGIIPPTLTYNPLILSTLDVGDLIQLSITLQVTAGNTTAYLNELFMTPICCEYIGGMQ